MYNLSIFKCLKALEVSWWSSVEEVTSIDNFCYSTGVLSRYIIVGCEWQKQGHSSLQLFPLSNGVYFPAPWIGLACDLFWPKEHSKSDSVCVFQSWGPTGPGGFPLSPLWSFLLPGIRWKTTWRAEPTQYPACWIPTHESAMCRETTEVSFARWLDKDDVEHTGMAKKFT